MVGENVVKILDRPVLICELLKEAFSLAYYLNMGPGVAQWLRHCATSRAVPGSNPGGVGHRDFYRGYRLP